MINPVILRVLSIRELLDIICEYLSLDEIFNLYIISNIPMSLKWTTKIIDMNNKNLRIIDDNLIECDKCDKYLHIDDQSCNKCYTMVCSDCIPKCNICNFYICRRCNIKYNMIRCKFCDKLICEKCYDKIFNFKLTCGDCKRSMCIFCAMKCEHFYYDFHKDILIADCTNMSCRTCHDIHQCKCCDGKMCRDHIASSYQLCTTCYHNNCD